MTWAWASEAVHHTAEKAVGAAESGGIHIGVHPEWHWGALTFNADSLIAMWAVTIILVAFLLILRFMVNMDPTKPPKGPQVFLEMVIDSLADFPRQKMGERGLRYAPLLATLFLFIVFSNWSEAVPLSPIYDVFFGNWLGHLPEFGPPTADLNVTVGLALVVFIATHYYGFQEKGFHYLQHFLKPAPVFLPLNILEELAKPFSLSIRLFGNVFGKEVIIMILVGLVSFPFLYPIPILVLSLFLGLIQAFIFTLLATIYLETATGEGH